MTPRRMSVGFQLRAAICFIVGFGLGWYAGQQVNFARKLRVELDNALLRAQVATRVATTSRQITEELRARADILAALDMTSVVLKGQPGAEDAEGRVFLSATRGAVIAVSNMPPLPLGQTYQVWFVLPSDRVSVGFAGVDATGRIFESVDPPADTTQLTAVTVTMEPEGGVEMPSGSVRLLGRTER